MKTASNTNSNKNNCLQEIRLNPDWPKLPLFDRSKWPRVKFGDVVANVNNTERNPQGAGIERFIGLEHLEPGSLHIRAWGNVAYGTTFNRRCSPGQVLFGKRRAYQRKVAMAGFDAVVSGKKPCSSTSSIPIRICLTGPTPISGSIISHGARLAAGPTRKTTHAARHDQKRRPRPRGPRH